MANFSVAPEQSAILEAYRSMNKPIVEKKKKDCGCGSKKKTMLTATDKEGKGHKRRYGKNVTANYSTDEATITPVRQVTNLEDYKYGHYTAFQNVSAYLTELLNKIDSDGAVFHLEKYLKEKMEND